MNHKRRIILQERKEKKHLRIPLPLLQRLEEFATERGKDLSTVIRSALRARQNRLREGIPVDLDSYREEDDCGAACPVKSFLAEPSLLDGLSDSGLRALLRWRLASYQPRPRPAPLEIPPLREGVDFNVPEPVIVQRFKTATKGGEA